MASYKDFADISNNQRTDPDWPAYKKKYDIIGLKVSQGTNFLDQTFNKRHDAAVAVGLKVIGYAFVEAGKNGSSQADWFHKCVGDNKEGLLPAIDVENYQTAYKPGEAARIVTEFAQQCVNLGYPKGLVYTGASFRNEHKLVLPVGWGWWIASYGTAQKPDNCAVWQYGGMKIPGITSDVDANHVYTNLFNYVKDEDMPLSAADLDQIQAKIVETLNALGTIKGQTNFHNSMQKIANVVNDTYNKVNSAGTAPTGDNKLSDLDVSNIANAVLNMQASRLKD